MDSTYSSLCDEKLKLYKEEIYQVYMKENKTLETTMSMMKEKHGSIAR